MTRETKVGLLVGTGVILLIGIIVSDHLAVVHHQEPAYLAELGERAQWGIEDSGAGVVGDAVEVGIVPARPLPEPFDTMDRTLPGLAEATGPAMDSGVASQSSSLAAGPVNREMPTLSQTEVSASPSVIGETKRAGNRGERLGYRSEADRVDDLSSGYSSAEPVSAQPVVHYVKRGETLWEIALKFYGEGEEWRLIAEANPKVVPANGWIRQGVRLVIPKRSTHEKFVRSKRRADTTTVVPEPRQQVKRKTEHPQNTRGGSGTSKRVIEVRRGDTLAVLAQRHLGSSRRWRELFEANRDSLTQPETLYVGMKLRLPDRDNGSRSTKKSGNLTGMYTVKPNDSLYTIAGKMLGDPERWREIYNGNRDRLGSADSIRVGQKLRIPQR